MADTPIKALNIIAEPFLHWVICSSNQPRRQNCQVIFSCQALYLTRQLVKNLKSLSARQEIHPGFGETAARIAQCSFSSGIVGNEHFDSCSEAAQVVPWHIICYNDTMRCIVHTLLMFRVFETVWYAVFQVPYIRIMMRIALFCSFWNSLQLAACLHRIRSKLKRLWILWSDSLAWSYMEQLWYNLN